MKKKIIGIVGPTASGKTALSLPLARQLSGHILCMDSMQVYTHMDIGTAKPTKEEQATVPHHLLDIVSPLDNFTVSQYAAWAKPLMDTLACPILVGGTGLYLQAVSQSMAFGQVGSDDVLREKYHKMAEVEGNRAVHRILEQIDPQSAARLHENDLRRVIRAIEVYELTGIPLSQQPQPTPEDEPYRFFLYAYDIPRPVMYDRCDKRVDQMIRDGLVDEVKNLLSMGVTEEHPSMQGLGYKEIIPYIKGNLSLEEAVSLIKLRTRHFAKRQMTWFRRDQRIQWLPWEETPDTHIARIINDYQSED
ncbi:MAG: tRNA (adenosine(37)-N6)-dimethylallyltransferase MiaA [Clostridia bacterium]|nr:tRNA (adenosine(37)-N6)-dimethylallyltransferase MiaA [Clostridia bacterium]